MLPPVDVGWREETARRLVGETGADAMVVTGSSNIRWLTGFGGSNATVVIDGERIVLYTDPRYGERAPAELAAAGSGASVVVVKDEIGDRIREQLAAASKVALESEYVSWAQQRKIAQHWLSEHKLVATTEVLDRARATKDQAELARISAAAHIADTALGNVVAQLRDRPTERTIADALEAEIRSLGNATFGSSAPNGSGVGIATDIGFDTIVASGPNGAIAHHSPLDRRIERGDLVIIDMGARVDGYRSDMTRTFSVGPLDADAQRHFDVVVAAQQAGVEAMVVGAQTTQVDAAARSVITQAGWGEFFIHGTGHGVGLDIHELPRVSASAGDQDRYQDGTVATVEPGVYLPGEAGVRIEDTCVATAAGAVRLTRFGKDPEI